MEQTAGRKRALVLGLGNPLGGDDAFGPLVLERLSQPGSLPIPDANLISAHTDLLGYLDLFSDYELVVLIDAILGPEMRIAPPGEVVTLAEESWSDYPDSSPGVHQISPLLAVRLYRKLYPSSRTRFVLVGLCTDRIRTDPAAPCSLTDDVLSAGAREVVRAIGGDSHQCPPKTAWGL